MVLTEMEKVALTLLVPVGEIEMTVLLLTVTLTGELYTVIIIVCKFSETIGKHTAACWTTVITRTFAQAINTITTL